MNNKKIVAGLLALTFAFGGAALPNTVVNNSVVASASESEYFSYGEFMCTMQEDGTVWVLEFLDPRATEVEIPAEINGAPVTRVGGLGFDNREIMTSVVIPDSVTKIDECAFHDCESLESIKLPENLEYLDEGAFVGCLNLKSITLPKKLKRIGYGVFEDCSSLESIDIPDSVEIIDEGAFKNCHMLSSVTLPKNLMYIGDEAFRNCSLIKNVVIPDSVEEIGSGAFSGCSKDWRSVTISKNVTVGYDAFSDYDEVSDSYKPSKQLMINCYMDSSAYWSALNSGSNFNVLDADNIKTKYPELIKEEYSSKYRQFRLKWTAVEGAEQYGIAVKIAGKWKVQALTDADVRTYTSPKLTANKKYIVAICAKINGEWDTSNLHISYYDGRSYGRTFPLTVR
ncbi:MAG: leucine-rich repeat domain-containing protein [Ruminococcus sp.]|uniref:leucine-rich repeat domain-containing protein n=1 Tax=Ruminococcus sp. TaxID=41978 RepID=UPI0025F67DFE|nr:leucine-rich repeat domain-containing protein [Ruminococcus sp.]MBO4866364.1 leucine-rich repeat domain-containing protein [Ruminococcus sp.]